MMSVANQAEPVEGWNPGLFWGFGATVAFFLLSYWFIPFLFTAGVMLGWLGISVISASTIVPMLPQNWFSNESTAPYIKSGVEVLTFVGTLVSFLLLPSMLAVSAGLGSSMLIGTVLGNSLFEWGKNAWSNYFNPVYEPIHEASGVNEDGNSTELTLRRLYDERDIFRLGLNEESDEDIAESACQAESNLPTILKAFSVDAKKESDEDEMILVSDEEDSQEVLELVRQNGPADVRRPKV